ncbi:MAG: DNA polymerase III subunit beta [Chloroflexi bacterium]|nr:DNA polymerase III subunit beta [Chloroflexota bacterium]MBR49518.1 DNA polymerase III subunit beta [Chloroflexota bacterium]|tara:strand:- start:6087 stop:7223 length:1137 start_codon:yes stop_codon:yes gene_type:complete
MKISCLQQNLSRGLAIVGRAVATRSNLPVLQNVKISTQNDMLVLTGTNLDIAITTKIGAQIEEEGEITIPARLLTDFVNTLPDDRIDIESSADLMSVTLKCLRFEANINGTDPSEFPPIPTVDEGSTIKIDPQILKETVDYVAFAAATEDSRPVLTGIKIEVNNDDFTFAAADGFRLAVYQGKLSDSIEDNFEFIIPARSMQEIGRLIGTDSSPVEFTVTPAGTHALFNIGNVEIVSQLMPGSFPNYRSLIPENYKNQVLADLSDFTNAVKTASIFARDGSGIVRIQIVGNGESAGLSISSRAEELGENQGEIDARVEGEIDEESRIAFNNKYLADVLDVLGDGEVVFEMTGASSPGVLRSISKPGYTHVVMPMFVQW